jgi:hypothetical protein
MKFMVKVNKDGAEIRDKSNEVSLLMEELNVSETEYTAIKYNKGWYYIEECLGWIRAKDTLVVKKIEDYNDEDLSGNNGDDENNYGGSINYDVIAIIAAINKASDKLNASSIMFTVGNTQVNLDTYIKSVKNTTDDMNKALIKFAEYTGMVDSLVAGFNKLIDDSGTKQYKVSLPLIDATVGVLDPITSAKSFVFDPIKESVVLNNVSMDVYVNQIDPLIPQDLSIDVEVYDDTGLLSQTVRVDLTNKNYNITTPVVLKSGYVKANIVSTSGLPKVFRGAVVLDFTKTIVVSDSLIEVPETTPVVS